MSDADLTVLVNCSYMKSKTPKLANRMIADLNLLFKYKLSTEIKSVLIASLVVFA